MRPMMLALLILALACSGDVTAPTPPSVTLCLSELHYRVEGASSTLQSLGPVYGGPVCATFTDEGQRVAFSADAEVRYLYTVTGDEIVHEDQVWPAGYTTRAEVFEREGRLVLVNWTVYPFWLGWEGTTWARSPGRLESAFETVNAYGLVTLRSVWTAS